MAIVATSMGMLNKLNDALRVPLEFEFETLVAKWNHRAQALHP